MFLKSIFYFTIIVFLKFVLSNHITIEQSECFHQFHECMEPIYNNNGDLSNGVDIDLQNGCLIHFKNCFNLQDLKFNITECYNNCHSIQNNCSNENEITEIFSHNRCNSKSNHCKGNCFDNFLSTISKN